MKTTFRLLESNVFKALFVFLVGLIIIITSAFQPLVAGIMFLILLLFVSEHPEFGISDPDTHLFASFFELSARIGWFIAIVYGIFTANSDLWGTMIDCFKVFAFFTVFIAVLILLVSTFVFVFRRVFRLGAGNHEPQSPIGD